MQTKLKQCGAAVVAAIGVFYCLCSIPTVYADVSIRITQVQISGGTHNTNDDFIEFFNPNSTSVNLKDDRLVKRSANGKTDTDIKVWTKDVMIPAHSFYLWANSGYTTIAVKPDITSSATLADDNGVALRQGANNSGVIIDGFSWGKANNGFPVAVTNPSAGHAVSRKDIYSATAQYTIVVSSPHNSSQNDLSAAYGSYDTPSANRVVATPSKNPTETKNPLEVLADATSSEQANATLDVSEPTITPSPVSANLSQYSKIPSLPKKQSKIGYLALAIGSFIVFVLLVIKVFPKL